MALGIETKFTFFAPIEYPKSIRHSLYATDSRDCRVTGYRFNDVRKRKAVSKK